MDSTDLLSLPEPAGFRMRYRSEPGMIGHYPWSYADQKRRRVDRPSCEVEDLYTAAQVRELLDAAVAAARADERERCQKIVAPALTWMENAWHRIDGEWGPSGKSLDEECAEGLEPEIAALREFLRT